MNAVSNASGAVSLKPRLDEQDKDQGNTPTVRARDRGAVPLWREILLGHKLRGNVPQHGYVLSREPEAREPLIVDRRQPLANAPFAGIVACRDEAAHKARSGLG